MAGGCASGVSSEGEGGGTKEVEAGTVLVRTNMPVPQGLGCRPWVAQRLACGSETTLRVSVVLGHDVSLAF